MVYVIYNFGIFRNPEDAVPSPLSNVLSFSCCFFLLIMNLVNELIRLTKSILFSSNKNLAEVQFMLKSTQYVFYNLFTLTSFEHSYVLYMYCSGISLCMYLNYIKELPL